MKTQEPIQEIPTLFQALKHSVFVLLLAAGGVSAWHYLYQPIADPFFTKIVVGKIAVVLFLLVLGGSYFLQERLFQKTSRWRRIFSWLFLLLTLPVALVPVEKVIRLIKNEKSELLTIEENNQKYLKHSVLGFSFLHPGEGSTPLIDDEIKKISESIEQESMGMMTAEVYAFDKEGEGVLLVMVLTADGQPDPTEAALKTLNRGFRQKLEASGGTVEQDEVIWQPDKKEALIRGENEEAFYFGRAFVAGLGQRPYLVAFMAVTTEPKTLDELIKSARP